MFGIPLPVILVLEMLLILSAGGVTKLMVESCEGKKIYYPASSNTLSLLLELTSKILFRLATCLVAVNLT